MLIALLAVLGSAGTFVSVTGNASAHNATPPSGASPPVDPSPSPSSPSVTDPTDNALADASTSASAGSSRTPADAPDGPAGPAGSGTPSGSTGPGQSVPAAGDFADIRSVRPGPRPPRDEPGASTGTFTSDCGRNEERHNNPDNFIVTPGVRNGAHHLHDYVGNRSTDAFSTDGSLRAAGTTCARGDKSAYFWPVLRRLSGGDGPSGGNGQDPADGNVGRVLTPSSVSLTFRGSPAGKVAAMPEGLRAITGDAKAFTNGTANARAQWTCTGFEDRRLADKYPLCPGGSRAVRVLDFPSCWDGANKDSANHRTHLVFPDRASGRCPAGTKAVPRLQMRLTYAVTPRPRAFALDSFPEQLRKPVTDHADFANFMPRDLMARAVACINSGRRCR
ncbi:hypothetical protein ADK76_24360 [Streptomyces griseoflavus]|nr:DUF1996 domain-containing protein [Streptomyces rimosus]KOG54263.1 hypothetical protein ADK76_24360 [Streptomyces griseoflavus]